jgi:ubiquinone/menaquinone biosynthesis C-methylase UbiE
MRKNERTFNPAAAGKLEDPERRRWLPPDEVVRKLAVSSGMCVADVGAGTGYFSLPLAAAVGTRGRVISVDPQPEMLSLLERKLASPGAPLNVELVSGTAISTGLPDAACDLVFLANVWHELDALTEVLDESRRILREGGLVAILDWRTDVERPPGPPIEHRVAMDSVVALLSADGWTQVSACLTGHYTYLVTGIRRSSAPSVSR